MGNYASQRQWCNTFKALEHSQPRIIYSVKIYLSKIKVKRFFSDEQMLRKLIAGILALWEILKKFLQAEKCNTSGNLVIHKG